MSLLYNLKGDDQTILRANVEIDGGSVTLHSRSGASGGVAPRNPDYSKALAAIIERLHALKGSLTSVLIDSKPSHSVSEVDRVLAGPGDIDLRPADELVSLINRKMRAFGRGPEMPPNQGNSNKRLLIRTSLSQPDLARALRLVDVAVASSAPPGENIPPASRSRAEPLPAAQLRKVEAKHIFAAVARLASGEEAKNFGPSTYYDAMTLDGERYAPKQVFGFALEEVLGIEAMPDHFSAGWGTPCFDIVEAAGLYIAPKNSGKPRPAPPVPQLQKALNSLTPSDEERSWIEGNPRIATHLVRERKPGLARKKRAAFIAGHGKLFCERCALDPVEIYGADAGEACIEVHHHRVQVADMAPDHETKLDDLKCLCANCHRVLHRELALGIGQSTGTAETALTGQAKVLGGLKSLSPGKAG